MMGFAQYAVRVGRNPNTTGEAKMGSTLIIYITHYAVRLERTLNTIRKPTREEQVHNEHRTVCSTGGTYPK